MGSVGESPFPECPQSRGHFNLAVTSNLGFVSNSGENPPKLRMNEVNMVKISALDAYMAMKNEQQI